MKRQLWKTLVIAVVCCMLIIPFAGCSGTSQPAAAPAEKPSASTAAPAAAKAPTTIVFWNGFGGSDRPVLESLVKKFNETHTDVQVKMEIMDWSVMYQKLTTSAASAQGPDFIVFGPENVATYANLGAIVPVDDFYETNMVDTSLFPAAFNQLIKYKGHYIGIPMNYFSHALFYNKDLAKKAGLDPENPPKTFDEMADWAVKMTDSKNGQYGLGIPVGWVHIPQIMWAFGGDVIDYTNKTSMLDKPESVKAMQWVSDLYQKGVAPAPNSDFTKMFAAGKLGMDYDGPWNTPQFKLAKVNYGVTLMPAGPVKQVTFAAGLSYHLTKKGSSNPETKAAFYKFVQWWFQKDVQKEWAIKIGFPPIRTDLENDPDLIAANPDLKVFMASSKIGQPWLVGIVNSQKILTDVFTKTFDEILLNKADVEKTLSQGSAEMDKILATER